MEQQTQQESSDMLPVPQQQAVVFAEGIQHTWLYSRLVSDRIAEYDRLTNNASEFASDQNKTLLKELSFEMRSDLEFLETSGGLSREFKYIKQLKVLEEAITWMKANIRVELTFFQAATKKKQKKAKKAGRKAGADVSKTESNVE